nr:MAG TPA: YopX protein [Caudoviricetes sp.]
MIPKFRAWDNWRKRMSAVDRIYIDTKGVRLHDDFGEYWRDFRDVELMQSTGLCDKEGTEVFEGDILRHQIQTEYTFIVKYDKDNGRWYGDGLSRTYRIDIAKRFLPYYYKVIGNIYENPELLEVENGE